MRIALFGANGQLGSDLVMLAGQRGLALLPVTRAQVDAADPEASFDDLAFDVAINCVALSMRRRNTSSRLLGNSGSKPTSLPRA